MSPLSIFILSLSMSADAFAASIARGASIRPTWPSALKGGLVFGSIEAITPLIGWTLGLLAAGFVGAVDHWLAFVLLSGVGTKMIWDATRRDDEADKIGPNLKLSALALIATAIGTSVDAAAVGVSLALIGVDILMIALAIGFTTFTLTTIGLMIGRSAGVRLGNAVELIGGGLLIGLGTLILFNHLGYFG